MTKRLHEEDYSGDLEEAFELHDPYSRTIYIAGKNEIHFSTHVNDATITRVKKLIARIVDENRSRLVKRDGKPRHCEDFVITYIVNSPGGVVTSILDFVDYIAYLRETFVNIKFTSIITGLVASAGTIMCVVADKRKMTRYAHAMIHELSGGSSYTNYTRILSNAEYLKKLHNSLVTIYQEARGIDPGDKLELDKLENLLLRETWMNADEYMQCGFVDEIVAKSSTQPQKENS